MRRTILALLLAGLPLLAFGQSADEDFFGADTATVSTEKPTTADATKQFNESADGLRWGGTVTSSAAWNGGFVGAWPDAANTWKDGLDYKLTTTLFLDGRPDKDFRFRLSLKTGYPFTSDTKNVALTSAASPATTTTISVPNIKVWEMFTDVTVVDAVFLRFGKQSASWGVSYFYSPGDVISLTAKDASDPTAEREGPVAMKASVPLPGLKANLTGFVLARDGYFGSELPTLKALGYALQGDVLVGDAELSLGGFYQRDNAPKLVATVNTGFSGFHLAILKDINLFSEAVLSYGSDVLLTSGSTGGATPTFTKVEKWGPSLYYTGTVGVSYQNSDSNLTLRTEYLYNPFGSDDKDVAIRAFNTFGLYVAHDLNNAIPLTGITSTAGRSYSYGDAATPGKHYLTTLLSLAKLGGNDKLSFSTFWQQNLSDLSGWVKPTMTFQPWDQLGFTWGFTTVYGDEGTQYPLTFQSRDAKGGILGTQRLTLNLGVTFGSGKY